MKKLFSAILILTIGFVFITDLYAQNSKGKMQRDKVGIEKLNLTEGQETKFDEIKFAHQEKVIDSNAQLRKNQLELKKIFASNGINEPDVMKLTEKSNNIRAELNKSKVKMWFDVNKILNDDQKQIWKDHFKNLGEKRKARFEKNSSARDKKDNSRGKRFNKTEKENFQD